MREPTSDLGAARQYASDYICPACYAAATVHNGRVSVAHLPGCPTARAIAATVQAAAPLEGRRTA